MYIQASQIMRKVKLWKELNIHGYDSIYIIIQRNQKCSLSFLHHSYQIRKAELSLGSIAFSIRY